MTDLLKKAFDAVSALPPESRDALAKMILAEIEDEKRWDEAFAKSQDKLAALADEAIAEYRAGDQRERSCLEVLGGGGSGEETLFQKGPSPESSSSRKPHVSHR